jgi:pyrimidine-nucleoside phosphorylase
MAQDAIDSGSGFEYLRKLVEAQGGDVSYVDYPEKLPEAPLKSIVEAPRSGYLSEVNARVVGETAVLLGAGRKKKGESIDLAVGISVLGKVGQQVEAGQPLFVVHANSQDDAEEAGLRLQSAVEIVDAPVEPLPLFYGLID